MTTMESLDALDERISRLDREQNSHRDKRHELEIRSLLVLIKIAEKRENRLSPYLRWMYIED